MCQIWPVSHTHTHTRTHTHTEHTHTHTHARTHRPGKSRAGTRRHRHLLLDLVQLLPHSKKDAKLDTKSDRGVINEVADVKARLSAGLHARLCSCSLTAGLQGCNNVLFFEARKHKDLYLWIAKCPDGPCVKFHVLNGAPQRLALLCVWLQQQLSPGLRAVHTLAELKLSGNHLKGSRPVLSFHKVSSLMHIDSSNQHLTQQFKPAVSICAACFHCQACK